MSKLQKILSLRERSEQSCVDKLAQSRRATEEAKAQADSLRALKSAYAEEIPQQALGGGYVLRQRFYAQLFGATQGQDAAVERLRREEAVHQEAFLDAYRDRRAIEKVIAARAQESKIEAKRKARRTTSQRPRAYSER